MRRCRRLTWCCSNECNLSCGNARRTPELLIHYALFVVSRITAGLLAALAFYFAFFLHEDEEGVWQNRIENLWMAVYDRAKVTDSTTTALFNKVSESVRKLGPKDLSAASSRFTSYSCSA